MSIIINDAELQALTGQSYMNYVIYLYLRRFMDGLTAVTGRVRGISYQSISEALYIEPRRGVKTGSPHKSAIRRALEQLEKSGLIKRLGETENLVFKLPFAPKPNNVQNKADTKPTPHPDTPRANKYGALKVQADTPKNAKADTPLLSINTINKPPPPKVILSIEKVKNSKTAAAEFSNIIKPENREQILQAMQDTDAGIWQTLVDDLTGYCSIQAGKGKAVNNPVGVMRRMVERVRLGEYVADLANIGQQIRVNEQRIKTQIAPILKAPLLKKPIEKQPRSSLLDALKPKKDDLK